MSLDLLGSPTVREGSRRGPGLHREPLFPGALKGSAACAAKCLARPDSATAGIVVCAEEGRSNLEALICLFNLIKVKAYDLYPRIAEQFGREMGEKLQLDIEPVKTLPEAVNGLDIVVTSGPIVKNPKPLMA